MIVWRGTAEFKGVQTVEVQLPDSDSSTGNKNSGSNNTRLTNAENPDMRLTYDFCDRNSLSGNISVDIRISDDLVYMKRRITVREKQALNCLAL
jgi:hypothetical protein